MNEQSDIPGDDNAAGPSAAADDFEHALPDHAQAELVRRSVELVVHLDGFDGPIDLLLTLARDQKVDLTKISILALAEQYLAFVTAAQRVRLELAADYLVMAAWLAYLKSRMLLPSSEADDEPTGEELAAALALQLKRLEAMREASAALLSLPRLGQDVFARGAPEGIRVITHPVYEASFYELLEAYGVTQRRHRSETLHIQQYELFSMDEALGRLERVLGRLPEWSTLMSFLPENLNEGLLQRSAVASTFLASLELVREGRAELRQDGAFKPLYFRSRSGTSPVAAVNSDEANRDDNV